MEGYINKDMILRMARTQDEYFQTRYDEAQNSIEKITIKGLREQSNNIFNALLNLPDMAQMPWIPIVRRPMDEEETAWALERFGAGAPEAIIVSQLPDDGQEVLVSDRRGVVSVDTYYDDAGCYFDGVDIDDVLAWMPMPMPYTEEREA